MKTLKEDIFLPWDLFKYKISICSKEHATYFKKWKVNINLT